MNTATGHQKNVFYIPAGVPFVSALARAVLTGQLPNPAGEKPQALELPKWTILLPTRRATRALMQAFIDEGDGAARLLPRIHPLGDVDEDELALSDIPQNGPENNPQGSYFEPPPDPISGLERQFVLYRLIHDWVEACSDNPLSQMLAGSHVHAFDLARSLGSLVDNFETGNVDLKIIDTLFDGEFAQHRQQILDFLEIVQKQLPAKMAEMNKIGASDHRNRLMQAHTRFLTEGKATGPVIAAGSTGSIPATAQLLSCIADMENGAVVLPGLDVHLDDDSWNSLPENHPQFGMRELLAKMAMARDDVALLPGVEDDYKNPLPARNWLASEIMRPAETTDQWRAAVTDKRNMLIDATANITILDADDQRTEAMAVALVMRHGLEINKSVALVTPDRQLARNVKAELARWNIEIDDSAGEPLLHTPHATFLRLLLEAARTNFSPMILKSLLAHRFACFGTAEQNRAAIFTKFEIALLRSDIPYDGLDGLLALCKQQMAGNIENHYAHPAFKLLDDSDWQEISSLAERLAETLQPLATLFDNSSPALLKNHIMVHLQVAEAACKQADQHDMLWCGERGEKLTGMFSKLQAAAPLAPVITARDYTMLLEQQLAETIIRPKHVRHGTLAIYGLLEARLISADILIMGGLNEAVWPPVSEVDAWLTRPQLRNAGLPVPERRIGLAAHDFAQGFCAPQVYLTYAKKLDNAPAVASRWILRLDALLKAADARHACDGDVKFPWLSWAEQIDKPDSFSPVARPAPKPASRLRPTDFSVTGIEALLKNPYGFFAEKILRLKPLNTLDRQVGAPERGSLVHDALQNFIQTYHDELPKEASKALRDMFEVLLAGSISDTSLRVFWRPQLARMADWFIDQEYKMRRNRLASHVEISGQYSFPVNQNRYTLKARADRLDILDDQTARIIDYKTGAPPSFSETAKGFSPQLLLEALIAAHGGFDGVEAIATCELAYVKLSGGVPAGEIKSSPAKLTELVSRAEAGMITLLGAYAQTGQPYLANPEPLRADMEREYDYLSRWREWAHLLGRGNTP